MITNTFMACEKSGMPIEHATCFQQIADRCNSIIACRAVGKWATGLIQENYASKGFHVKAKSCNWGPMAGFVLTDPRFSKKGTKSDAVASQTKAIKKAISTGAKSTPVFISSQRKNTLINVLNCMTEVERRSDTEIVYKANADACPSFKFILKQHAQCPIGVGGRTWQVFYHDNETPCGTGKVTGLTARFNNNSLVPITALTNPGADASYYKSALTGDYDLWGVYAKSAQYNPRGDDRRLAQGSNHSVKSINIFCRDEDEHLGNITARVDRVRNLLNQAIRGTGYTNGDMVHHSDELGRPLVNEVEFEFIAFFPGEVGKARFIGKDSMGDFSAFIAQSYGRKFHPVFNPGWIGKGKNQLSGTGALGYKPHFSMVLDQLRQTVIEK